MPRLAMRVLVVVLLGGCEGVTTPHAPHAPQTVTGQGLIAQGQRGFDSDTAGLIGPSPDRQDTTLLVVDGTSALVLWRDDRQDPRPLSSLFSAQFSDDGSGLSLTRLSVPSVPPLGSPTSAVAVPGAFLVAHEQGSISTLSDAGQFMGSSGGAQRVFRGPNYVFGMTWVRATGAIEATILPLDGGPSRQLTIPNATAGELNFAAAESATQFLVVFPRTLDGGPGELLASRVSFTGAVSPPAVLTNNTFGERQVSVASNGAGFIAAWQRREPNSDGGVHTYSTYAAIDAMGVMVNQVTYPNSPIDSTEPRICFAAGQYWALSTLRPGGQAADLQLGPMSPTLAVGPDPVIVSAPAFHTQLGCAANGNVVVAWSQWDTMDGGASSIRALVQDSDGGQVAAPFFVSRSGERQSISSSTPGWVTFSTPRGGFLVAVDGGPDASIPVDESARAAASPGGSVLLVETRPQLQVTPFAQNGLQLAAARPLGFTAGSAFISVGDAGWDVVSEANGTLLHAHLAQPSSAVVPSFFPIGSVGAFAGASNAVGDHLLVFEDPRPPAVGWSRAFGQGQSGSSAATGEPTVASFGDRWLVVWLTGSGLVGTIVEANGLSDGGIFSLGSSNKSYEPSAACTSTTCAVVWVDFIGSWDLVGRTIAFDGSLGPFTPLISGPTSELNPHLVAVGPDSWQLAFDRYEPTLGTRRAFVAFASELIDGGMVVDPDGGAPDASVDGGDDGGSFDAGAGDGGEAPDASIVDSGLEPDGGTTARHLSVGCGCSTRADWGPLLLIGLSSLRRRKRR